MVYLRKIIYSQIEAEIEGTEFCVHNLHNESWCHRVSYYFDSRNREFRDTFYSNCQVAQNSLYDVKRLVCFEHQGPANAIPEKKYLIMRLN